MGWYGPDVMADFFNLYNLWCLRCTVKFCA